LGTRSSFAFSGESGHATARPSCRVEDFGEKGSFRGMIVSIRARSAKVVANRNEYVTIHGLSRAQALL
jgi:hypothetical protein